MSSNLTNSVIVLDTICHMTKSVILKIAGVTDCKLQISAFFLFSNFPKKVDCSIFTLSIGRSVGCLVGQSVDVTIHFFQYIEA